jgi:hypothetical protein
MDVDRMLEKCMRDQWTPDEVDYSVPPRPMTRDEEEAVVQYFHNMSAIERFAKALFEEQQKRVRDRRLEQIYATFVLDEERHAQVAERLARHYDVHHYKRYRVSPEIERFKPYFLSCIKYMSDEVANAYITGGEIMLDVALLRSIDDYVADSATHRAMELINRDESRHIAVDYHMVEYYTSDAYWNARAERGRAKLSHYALGAWSFVNMVRTGGPFFMHMFFLPMRRTDPNGRRMFEAFKRMQLLQNMPGVERSPLGRFMLFLRFLYNHPFWGRYFAGLAVRLSGLPPEALGILYTREEGDRARRRGFDWLAQQTVGAT